MKLTAMRGDSRAEVGMTRKKCIKKAVKLP